MTDKPTIGDYIHEMVMDTTSLLDEVQQAARHNADGDEQSACNLIALTHYKLDQLADERSGLLELFGQRGTTPGS